MHSLALRRALALATVPILAFFTAVLGSATAASGHDVSGINASCNEVTVHFVDFPQEGVVVHIAATVQGHGTLASNVLVKNNMSTNVNIASETSALAGATAAVNVDVTWTFQGAQHVHETLHVTCGTAHCVCTTTTTTHAATMTTTHKAPTRTTAVAGFTVPTEPTSDSTSPNIGGATNTTSTTVDAASVTGNNGASSGDNGAVGAATANGNTGGITPTANRTGTLPFTGTATVPLLILGLAAIAAGATMVMRSRKRQQVSGS